MVNNGLKQKCNYYIVKTNSSFNIMEIKKEKTVQII